MIHYICLYFYIAQVNKTPLGLHDKEGLRVLSFFFCCDFFQIHVVVQNMTCSCKGHSSVFMSHTGPNKCMEEPFINLDKFL